MPFFTRRQVAEKVGVGFDTLRYYEKVGLLMPTERGENNYRLYDENAVEKLFFIHQVKQFGFSLSEIKSILVLLDNPQNCEVDSDEIIDLKVKDIEAKIEELTKIKAMLLAVKGPIKQNNCDDIMTALRTEK